MWYSWVWWQMSAEDHWLDEIGNPDFPVWVSVNRYWSVKDQEWKF
jgi:hypothetical protein